MASVSARVRSTWLVAAWVGLWSGACAGSNAFSCERDDQCVEAGAAGYCELDGYCSFDDDTCDSGRRFGQHAIAGVANSCVPVDGTSGGGPPGSSGPATDPTTDADATTLEPPGSTSEPVASTDDGSTTTGSACTATRLGLTIPAGTVDGPLTDFPVLVRVTAPELAALAGDPSPLAFTSTDEPSPLAFELERLDDTGELLAWVRLPTVAVDAETRFDLWLDRQDLATGPDAAGVWDDDYVGVWHLSVDDGSVVDATGQQPPGVPSNGVTAIDTALGGGAAFDGSAGIITIDHTFAGALTSFTTQLWVAFEVTGTNVPLYRRLNGTSLYPRLYVTSGGTLALQAAVGGVTNFLGAPARMLEGAPHHVAVSFDAPTSQARIYVDGELAGMSEFGPGDLDGGSNALELGSDANLDSWLLGTLDELRVSEVVRSDEWIRANFATQSDPGAFTSVGAPETVPCP